MSVFMLNMRFLQSGWTLEIILTFDFSAKVYQSLYINQCGYIVDCEPLVDMKLWL